MDQRVAGVRLVAAVVIVLAAAAAVTSLVRGQAPSPVEWPSTAEVLPSPTSEIPDEFGQATWALDPAFRSPGASSTDLHILVWERACSSGRPTTGRMSAPLVEYEATSVTIRIGVRPMTDSQLQTCPGPPGTPAIVRLGQPLGDRTLLDGGRSPVGPPSPGFIASPNALTILTQRPVARLRASPSSVASCGRSGSPSAPSPA